MIIQVVRIVEEEPKMRFQVVISHSTNAVTAVKSTARYAATINAPPAAPQNNPKPARYMHS